MKSYVFTSLCMRYASCNYGSGQPCILVCRSRVHRAHQPVDEERELPGGTEVRQHHIGLLNRR